MKIRNGFVSNSSSSSFVVGLKDKNDTTIKVSFEVDLSAYGEVISNVKDLKRLFIEDRYMDEEDEDGEEHTLFNKCVKLISCGGAVVLGSFTDENGGVEAVLCEFGIEKPKKGDKYTIIQNEADY